MIVLWILAGIVWLAIGYSCVRVTSKQDGYPPPLIIVIGIILLGPIAWIEVWVVEGLLNLFVWLGSKTNFSMEKYIRKFLGMKEK